MRIVIALFLSFSLLLSAADTESVLDKSPIFEHVQYGVLIKSLGGANVIESYQNNKSFAPASVMKLVTTATALEKLTPEFRYTTKLKYRGEIVDGVLNGDIIIKGEGDPTLGSRFFYDNLYGFLDVWVNKIEALGIYEIKGAIISDASVFDKRAIPDKWIWEDIGNYYGAGCYGLSCFDNTYRLYFSQTAVGNLAKVDSILPKYKRLSFESHVLGADDNKDNAYIYGSPWCFEKRIYGTIPAGREGFMIKGALPNPPLVLADLLKEKLEARGILVTEVSHVLWERNLLHSQDIAMWLSPKLADIIKVTNKESNNLFAEHLLKTTVMDGVHAAKLSVAIDSMMAFWSNKGLATNGVKVYDGSGMSRATFLTPDFVVGVIDYMSSSPYYKIFFESLAIAGVDGTFRYFLDGTELQGVVHGKSGSMSGVRCYAGIVEKSPQEKYSFCIMVNNFAVSSAEVKKAIEVYLCDVLK